MERFMGMFYEDVIEQVADYGWEMDNLYVSPDGERWYAVELFNWVVVGWERV